jgi:hypothetical protein
MELRRMSDGIASDVKWNYVDVGQNRDGCGTKRDETYGWQLCRQWRYKVIRVRELCNDGV